MSTIASNRVVPLPYSSNQAFNPFTLKALLWDFPGSPAVKTLSFQCRGREFVPGLGNTNPTGHGGVVKKKFLGTKNYKTLLEENIAEIFITSYLAIITGYKKHKQQKKKNQ